LGSDPRQSNNNIIKSESCRVLSVPIDAVSGAFDDNNKIIIQPSGTDTVDISKFRSGLRGWEGSRNRQLPMWPEYKNKF